MKKILRVRPVILVLVLWLVYPAAPFAIAQTDNGCHQQQFGKFSEWSEPVNLGPVVNSEFNDQWPVISPNGLSLYFASNRPGFGLQDIWVTHRPSLDAPWEEPRNLGPNINTEFRDNSPTLSSDGHWLIFGSNRPGGCGDNDLYVSYRENTEDDLAWEPAVNLGCEINSAAEDVAPTILEDEEMGITTLYFASNRPEGLGDFDVYASTLRDDGTFGPAVLVPELSTPLSDGTPSIRRDGLEMFLCWNAPVGAFFDCDLWVSTRETTADSWSTPQNLGPPINTDADDAFPALSCDGTTLYFGSNRPGGSGGEDLYVTTRKKLPE